ncbi:hypothetical protein ERJ75_001775900 [Trypanosoma vivax]|nr:hypothetical protein ERJ75_001775900 [Trypanosoma vivax]
MSRVDGAVRREQEAPMDLSMRRRSPVVLSHRRRASESRRPNCAQRSLAGDEEHRAARRGGRWKTRCGRSWKLEPRIVREGELLDARVRNRETWRHGLGDGAQGKTVRVRGALFADRRRVRLCGAWRLDLGLTKASTMTRWNTGVWRDFSTRQTASSTGSTRRTGSASGDLQCTERAAELNEAGPTLLSAGTRANDGALLGARFLREGDMRGDGRRGRRQNWRKHRGRASFD